MAMDFILRLAATFISYFWPPKRLHPQPTGKETWAVVTGATAGVGLALSHELCSRGFNVIVHGRDSKKLEALQSSIRAGFPNRECAVLMLDAADCFSHTQYEISRSAIYDACKNRNVTVLINNVGIGHNITEDFRSLTSQTPASIDLLLSTNIVFMTHLTRNLLPTLSSNAPSTIVNVGSLAELAMPYLTVYSATKAYASTITKALDAEMRAEGLDVKVECMMFGDIDTPGHPMKQSLSVLGAEQAAKCTLDRGGSMGYLGLEPVGAPYWFHGLLLWLCRAQPWWMLREGFIHNLKAKSTYPKIE